MASRAANGRVSRRSRMRGNGRRTDAGGRGGGGGPGTGLRPA
jgi:hypothetical protein